MRRIKIVFYFIIVGLIFSSCDKEEEVNQPPVVDVFEIDVFADGNTVYGTIDYAASDPDGNALTIVFKKNILQETYSEKNLTSDKGSFQLDLSRNTPYRLQLIVTDSKGESVGVQIKVFVPLFYDS